MKIILLLLTITLGSCSCSKFVRVDDDSIVIERENGRQVVITKKLGPFGQHVMKIDIKGPNDSSKQILITEETDIKFSHHDESNPTTEHYTTSPSNKENVDTSSRLKRSEKPSAAKIDSFTQIMKDYQSVTDEDSFENLLKRVEQSVKKGKIDSTILDYLHYLSQKKSWSHLTKSGFEESDDLLRNRQSGVDGNYWQIYPILTPTRQWYEQKLFPEGSPWQNNSNLKEIRVDKSWNEEIPPNYQKYITMYPVFPSLSSQLNSEDSTTVNYRPSTWLGGQYWVNHGRMEDKLPWQGYH